MTGELYGTPEEILAAARSIFNAISPIGRARLNDDQSEIIFETSWAKGVIIDRIRIRDGVAKELIRHASVMSLKASLYEAAGHA